MNLTVEKINSLNVLKDNYFGLGEENFITMKRLEKNK